MKKVIKRTLATLMTIVMLLTAIPLSNRASAKDIGSCNVGDVITYGSYPQSKVTDSVTLTALNNISKSWISYGYYSGTGYVYDGEMKPSDYMKYCDISYNGNKYRAVTFSQYRPYLTGDTSSSSNTYQDDNRYYTGNVYYFRYDPLKWRVLDPSEGFVMCTTSIDAQAYNNYVVKCSDGYYSDGYYYGNSAKTYYASDWANSSIRAWLNDDFYNTAFSSTEKSQIGTTYNENKSTHSSEYDSANTSDKIFLLSYNEATNSSYGLNNTTRQLKSTDYAKCQGCWQSTDTSYRGNSWWRLRSPYYSYYSAYVYYDGYAYYNDNVSSTGSGVVPAFKFYPKSTICDTHSYSSAVTLQPTCTTDGVRKYTCTKCSDSYTEKIDKLGHSFGEWKVTTPPTTQKTGVETRYCSRCTATETRTVDKLSPITLKVQDTLEINYKAKSSITTLISDTTNIKSEITYKSSNPSVVIVDNSGNVYGAKKGSATITCTVTDIYGNSVTDTCKVTVSYAWWQWIIEIVLLGFLWY